MRKYYIYLNGERYMEMPKAYNIKQDVYMNYSDLIDRYLKGRGVSATAGWNKKIRILSKLVGEPQFTDNIIRHELTHIKQMREVPKFQSKYGQAAKLLSVWENPYEVEAMDWGSRNWEQLHRVGKSDIYHQKALEKWQKERPRVFKAYTELEKISKEMLKKGETMPGLAERKRESEQNLAKAIKQVKKHGGEPEVVRPKKWQEDYLTKKQVEILRKRLGKFTKGEYLK